MIKKRKPDIIEESAENNSADSSIDLGSKKELKSYNEEVIMVLNILESKNIDIYNENNTPGMYLNKKKKNSQISSQLKLKIKNSNKTINKSNETNPQNLNNLFQYLKIINTK